MSTYINYTGNEISDYLGYRRNKLTIMSDISGAYSFIDVILSYEMNTRKILLV